MKRNFECLSLIVLLSLLVWCFPGAAQDIDTTDWVDIGGLRIPPAWSVSPVYDEDEGLNCVNITGEGANGSIRMFLGYGLSGPTEDLIEESLTSQEFIFDDKQSGYMLEFPELIAWTRESREKDVLLYHDGDRSVFTDNEELILSVVRTLNY